MVFQPWSSHTKDLKMVLDAALPNNQQSGAIQGIESRPPLHLAVVAIGKGTFNIAYKQNTMETSESQRPTEALDYFYRY